MPANQGPQLMTFKVRIIISILLRSDSGKGWSTAAIDLSAVKLITHLYSESICVLHILMLRYKAMFCQHF